jgi:hypothetical protein
MRRGLGRYLKADDAVSHVLGVSTALRLRSARPGYWPAGQAATYAHTGTAVAFIISELPGERAEALFIAMAALVPTAGGQRSGP